MLRIPGAAARDERRVHEAAIARVGAEIASALPKPRRGVLERIDRYAMSAVTDDPELRAALFRFVDVLPVLPSAHERARHLVSYLSALRRAPLPLRLARRLGSVRETEGLVGWTAESFVRHLARRFIVGETPGDAYPTLFRLAEQGVGFSVDLLGESTLTMTEAAQYERRCYEALDVLAATVARLPMSGAAESDSFGLVPRINLSVKVSALTPMLRSHAPELAIADARTRLVGLMERAKALGAHLHIDMESLDWREVVTDLVFSLLAEPRFADGPSVGMVIQAYLSDSPHELDRVLERSRSLGRTPPLVVRLVKGAYFDHELALARQRNWPSPLFLEKAATDRNFEQLTTRLLAARPLVRVAVASHNLRSVAHAIAESRRLGAADADLELQVLRGLGDDLGTALAARGFRVRAYCPIGDLVAGMAYLVRRLLENTSNESFLHERAEGVPLDELLAAP